MSQPRASHFLVFVILVCGCSQSPAPIEPVPPNDFLASMACFRVDSGNVPVQFEEEIEVKVNHGLIVHFTLEPNAEMPREFDGDRVCSLDQWGMCVAIAPRDKQQSRKHIVHNPVNPLHWTPYPGPVNRGSMIRWTECGLELKDFPQQPLFQQPKKSSVLKPPPKNPPKLEKLYFWTYFCGPIDEVGEFVYEVQLFPTSYYTTPFRTHAGSTVVLKRGILRVVPE